MGMGGWDRTRLLLLAGSLLVSHVVWGAEGISGKGIVTAFPTTAALPGILTPPTITTTQNNYSPTGLATASVLRLCTDASRDLTGIAGGTSGRLLLLHNVCANPLVLKDESASSTDVNRFALPADVTLDAEKSAMLQHDLAAVSTYSVNVLATQSFSADRIRLDVRGQPVDVGAGAFTIEMWVRGTAANNASATGTTAGDTSAADYAWINGHIFIDRDVVGSVGTGGDWGASFIPTSTDSAVRVVRFGLENSGGTQRTIQGSTHVLDDTWHHVAVTRSGANLAIYVDGVLDFNTTNGPTGNLAYDGPATCPQCYLTFGHEKHYDSGVYNFNGYMDEIRVWDVERTATQILENMCSTLPGNTANLKMYLRLEEGSGTAPIDATGLNTGITLNSTAGSGGWATSLSTCLAGSPRWRLIDPSGASTGDITDVWGCTTGNCSTLTGAAGDSLDAGSADSIRPETRSTSVPGTCSEGQLHQDTDSGGTELYVCTATNAFAKVGEDARLSGDLTPAQITATQNNYAPAGISTAPVLRVTTDAARIITGLRCYDAADCDAAADGRLVTIMNVNAAGGGTLQLTTESGSSTAANRFTFGADQGGRSYLLSALESVTLWYDATSSRWRAFSDGLPLSGVTAGTYGGYDTSAFVQFDDRGRVVSASDRALRSVGENFAFTGVISPTQIVANTDNYAPTGLSTATGLRLSTDAARDLTGITGGVAGRILFLHNVGSFNLVLRDDVTSTAANRFALTGDFTLTPDMAIILQYDNTSLRWRLVADGAGGGTGDIMDVWGCTTGNCNALTGAAGDSLDAGSADSSRPETRSTSVPGTCAEGQLHQDTDSGGTELYVCTATNAFTKVGIADPTLGTDTAGNYVDSVASNNGITGGAAGSEGAALTVGFDYAATLASNPTMAAGECRFASSATERGLICEGATADGIEVALLFADPISTDKTLTAPAETGTLCSTGSVCSGYQAGPLTGDVTTSGAAATIAADSVALTTDTTGNYVSAATASQGLLVTGTEGASLGLID